MDDTTTLQRVDASIGILQGSVGNNKACFICGFMRQKGCFAPDMQLQMADGSLKRAREIAVGDLLWNPITRKGVKVLKVIEGPEPIGLVELAYQSFVLRVSQKHAVLTPSGLKLAGTLQAGDIITDGQGKPQKLKQASILPVEEGQRVINFILESDSSNPDSRMLLSEGVVSGDLIVQNSLVPQQEK